MRSAKFIAILGAIILIISFFLTWIHFSSGGISDSNTGFGIAVGRPPILDSSLSGLSGYDPEEDLDYMGSFLEEYLGGSGRQLAGALNSLNKLFSDWTLFFFPAAGVLVILFSLISNFRPSKSYGVFLVLLVILLGIFMFTKVRFYNKISNISGLANSAYQLLGLESMMMSYKFGLGIWGTILGLVVVLLAGLLAWQSYDKESPPQHTTVYQQAPPASPYGQYPAYPPQQPWQQPQQAPQQPWQQPQQQWRPLQQDPQQQWQEPPQAPETGKQPSAQK